MFSVSAWSVFDAENYEEIKKEAISSSEGQSDSIFSLSLLKEKDFRTFSRQWLYSWFHSPERDSFVIVLLQSIDSDSPRESECSTIKLYEGHEEDAALDSFEVLKSFFSILTSRGGAHYSVKQLQQLVTSEGPLATKELILRLAHLDIPGPLSHPDLHRYLSSSDKDGNSLLHMAASHGSSKVIKTLSSLASVDLKSVNKQGENAMFAAIQSNQLGALLALLFEDFDPNSRVKESGDTALHVAARAGFLSGVKALILFGADVLAKNSKGKTATDSAKTLPTTKSIEDCIQCLEEIQLLDEKNGYVQDTPTASLPSTDSSSPCLLCLDGGGIRGLVEVIILTELNAVLRELDPTASHLVDYFDFVAGTSTGSFIAASLVYQRLPPTSLKKMYFHFKDTVFLHEKPIRASVSNKAAKEAFGVDQVLTAATSPKVMIATTIPEYEPPLQHLMCNYGKARDGQKAPHERKVWEACRASSAAPTYFVPFEDRFIDGGVMANNPTLDAMTEAVWLQEAAGQPLQLAAVVSLGTGLCPQAVDPPIVPHVDWWNPAEVWRAVRGVGRLLQVMLSEITASSGVVVQRARAWCRSLACPYYRLSPQISPVKLDELEDGTLVDMMYETLLYARAERPLLREIALTLLQHRRQQ